MLREYVDLDPEGVFEGTACVWCARRCLSFFEHLFLAVKY